MQFPIAARGMIDVNDFAYELMQKVGYNQNYDVDTVKLYLKAMSKGMEQSSLHLFLAGEPIPEKLNKEQRFTLELLQGMMDKKYGYATEVIEEILFTKHKYQTKVLLQTGKVFLTHRLLQISAPILFLAYEIDFFVLGHKDFPNPWFLALLTACVIAFALEFILQKKDIDIRNMKASKPK